MTEAKFHDLVIQFLVNGLAKWLFPYDIQPIFNDEIPPRILLAIAAQCKLRWGNLIHSFVARQWVTASKTLHDCQNDTPTATSIGTTIIHLCIQFFLHQWTARNGALHGKTHQAKAALQQQMRDTQIDQY